MADQRPNRFFVTIIAPDRQGLLDVVRRDLDLFASRSDKSGHRIDGLITLEDVGKLVEAGYQVLVAETDRPRYRHRFIGAEDWMKGTLAELKQQRKRR
ncbi:hypothetical protein [Bradyrhizobium sp.]|jgi:hypothetical protein|uniref:hypothetical protein n=1 Tax=Bradyrhizobium sp. TaxID=376 RepID=UPI003C7469BD